jgi:hypothetical protein
MTPTRVSIKVAMVVVDAHRGGPDAHSTRAHAHVHPALEDLHERNAGPHIGSRRRPLGTGHTQNA